MAQRIKWIFTISKIKNNIRDFDIQKRKTKDTKKSDKLLRKKLCMEWMCAHKNSIVAT